MAIEDRIAALEEAIRNQCIVAGNLSVAIKALTDAVNHQAVVEFPAKPAAAVQPPEAAEKPRRTRAAKSETQEPATQPATAPTAEPAAKADEPTPAADDGFDDIFGAETPAEPAKVYARDEVKQALIKMAAKHGRGEAVKILGKYNATSMDSLKEEDFAKVMADVEAKG